MFAREGLSLRAVMAREVRGALVAAGPPRQPDDVEDDRGSRRMCRQLRRRCLRVHACISAEATSSVDHSSHQSGVNESVPHADGVGKALNSTRYMCESPPVCLTRAIGDGVNHGVKLAITYGYLSLPRVTTWLPTCPPQRV